MSETSFKTAWVRFENKNLSFKKQNRMSYGWEGMVTLSGKVPFRINLVQKSALGNIPWLISPSRSLPNSTFIQHLVHASLSNLCCILRTPIRGLEPTGLIIEWMIMLMAGVTEWSGQKFLPSSYSYLSPLPSLSQLTFWSLGVLLPASPMDEKSFDECKRLTHKKFQKINN